MTLSVWLTLTNHGAQQCGAYAAAQVSHDVEESRSVPLLFPQPAVARAEEIHSGSQG